MLYLLISIAAMTALAIVLRWGVVAGADPYGVNLLLRCLGAAALLAIVVVTVEPADLGPAWREGGWSGLAGALFFFFAGLAAVKAVQLGHLGLSWTMLRCSMVVPVLASLLVWRELPLDEPSVELALRLGGIVVAVGAVLLMGWDRIRAGREMGVASHEARSRRWFAWALTAFVAQGVWEVFMRSTREYDSDASRLLFMAAGIGGAALLSTGAAHQARARVRRREWSFGLGAGILVLIVTVARIWALRELPGVVVFPVTTIAVMVLVKLAGMGIWGERTGGLGWLGFLLAVAGVAMLTVQP